MLHARRTPGLTPNPPFGHHAINDLLPAVQPAKRKPSIRPEQYFPVEREGEMKSATRIWMLLLAVLILAIFPSRASAQENETYTLRCSSEDMRRHECNIPYDEIMDVDVARQFSGSPCIECESWGFQGNILWVDRGCRADFRVWTLR
jgi:hypothetical protein